MPDFIPVFDDHTYIMIDVLLENAVNCPGCYAHRKSLRVMSEKVVQCPRYVVSCGECNYQGPFGKHVADAIKLWNRPPSLWALLCKFLKRQQYYPRQRLTRMGART